MHMGSKAPQLLAPLLSYAHGMQGHVAWMERLAPSLLSRAHAICSNTPLGEGYCISLPCSNPAPQGMLLDAPCSNPAGCCCIFVHQPRRP